MFNKYHLKVISLVWPWYIIFHVFSSVSLIGSDKELF